MKKIGVISDTHIGYRFKALPPDVFRILDGVDLIVHAGDVMEPQVIEELKIIAPVKLVVGNNDGYEIYQNYKCKEIFSVEGKRFLVVHNIKDVDEKELEEEQIDCVIYGHSHIAKIYEKNGRLYFNPGSPTDKRRAEYFTLGLIYIEKTMRGEIVSFT